MAESMPIPRVFHRIWLGGAPRPAAFDEFWQRWADLHPGWQLRTWTEADLPVLRNQAAFDDIDILSSKSNIARYEILAQHGGVYVDCDMEPLRNIEPLLADATFVAAEETPGVINNAFIAAEPGHPLLDYIVSELPRSHRSQPDAISPQRTGPRFFSRCIHRATATGAADGIRIVARDDVYPYSWDQPGLPTSGTSAYMVHHWRRSWLVPASAPTRARRLVQRIEPAAERAKQLARKAIDRFESLEPLGPLRGSAGRATYVGDGTLLVRTAAGHPILAFADDLCVTPALVQRGSHDTALMHFLHRELSPGDVVVDVGANIGLITLQAAHKVRTSGRVIAIEPNPEVFDLLSRSLYMNRMEGLTAEVTLHHAAAGASSGTSTLHVPRHHRGRASLKAVNATEAPTVPTGAPTNADGAGRGVDTGLDDIEHVDVPVVALDDLLSGIAFVDLVKIDVEGAELGVLLGMTRLLAEGRIGMICLELDHRLAGPDWAQLCAMLDALSRTATATFTIDKGGRRVPFSVDAAIHAPRMASWCLEFRDTRRCPDL